MLSQKVAESHDFINYMNRFGQQFQNQLGSCDGDPEMINIDMGDDRPRFANGYNMYHGLKILMNDTEETNIYFEPNSFECNEDGWCIDVCTEITDHFGLDKNDVLGYQLQMNPAEWSSETNIGHFGFNAWWVLQHERGYVPFKTKVNIKTTICGQF